MSAGKPGHSVAEFLSPIQVNYLFPAEVDMWRQRSEQALLAEIHFGGSPGDHADYPRVSIGMPQLGEARRVEVWSSRLPTAYHRFGRTLFAENSEIIFGCVNQPLPPAGASTDEPVSERMFETLVREAYTDILRLADAQGYPYLIRMWNYFPEIGRITGGLDRYQYFCRGRAQALEDYYGEFNRKSPSASAIGSHSGDLIIYFIAARQPGEHRGNPRQVNAYRYPSKYGPRSPSFARATLKSWGDRAYLYISGTASIVGHESLHADNVQAQLEETLRNLDALLESVTTGEGAKFNGLSDLTHCKIYIRNPAHFSLIKQELDKRLAPEVSRLYLQADICRSDLLLEIEGIATARRG